MNIIISGGMGYVGGRLSDYLARQGHTVTALSRQAKNLSSLSLPARLSVKHPDVFREQPEQLKEYDVFIHLAALNENDCVSFPDQAIEVNVMQTRQWLDLAHKAGINQFVYFSTAHVYGKPLQGYYDEQSLTQPVHPYAITHKCAEDYVLSYRSEKKMNNLVIRLTNSFGGPAFPTADRWTLLVNDLCRSAVNNGSMSLLSDGLQQRDFITLQDVCAATEHLLTISTEEGGTGIFNLGNGKSQSVWDMALQVKETAESFLNRPIALTRKEPGDQQQNELIISTTRLNQTGFKGNGNSFNEIESTIGYFLTHKSG